MHRFPFPFRSLARASFPPFVPLLALAAACGSSPSTTGPDGGATPDGAPRKDSGASDGTTPRADGTTGHRDSGPKDAGTPDAGRTPDTGLPDVGAPETGTKDAKEKPDAKEKRDAKEKPDAARKDSGLDSGPVTHPTDVLTQRADNSRSSVYAAETILTRANVTQSGFGELFAMNVDGQVYAQPLYVSDYVVGGQTHDVVIVATENNSVYAFDADTAGPALWHRSLGTPIPNGAIASGYNDLRPLIGITSTPVIDRENGLLYVANKDLTGADGSPIFTHRLHVLSLATGAELAGSPFVLNPSVAGTVDDASTLVFDPQVALQRPALLLLNGLVYLAFGSHGDHPPYHGFLAAYAYDGAQGSLHQAYAWSTSQDVGARLPGNSAGKGAIWQAGQGPTVDGDGNLYVMVANGATTVQDGGTSYGQAFVKLSPSLEVLDWFVPYDYRTMTGIDDDLGSGGAILIPGTKYLVGARKYGTMYVLDTTHMGHLSAEPDVNTNDVTELDIGYQYYGTPVAWNGEGETRLYVWPIGPAQGGLKVAAYPLQDGAAPFSGTNVMQAPGDAATTPPSDYYGDDPVGILAISCNGDTPGSGILWANKPIGNPNQSPTVGILYAFDPITLAQLWSGSVGQYAKFVPPMVANGKVYIPGSAFGDGGVSIQVQAYGRLP